MSGPGSTTVAYAEESGGYLSGPAADPSYVLPGEDTSFDDLSIDNQLSAISAPDSTLPKRQLAGNFEGGFGASWTLNSMSPQPWHDLIFPRDSDGSGTRDAYDGDGSFPSSEWYVSVAQPDGTVTERVLQGVVITSVSWEWSPDSPPEVSMTGVYGNERSEAAVTPGTIDRPDGAVPAHGATLTYATEDKAAKLQSATLSVENIAQLQRGASRFPVDVVEGAPQVELEIEKIYETSTQLEYAYETAGATQAASDTLDSASAALTFDYEGTTVADYTLSGTKPNSLGWNQVPPGEDENVTETITLQGTDIQASA